MKNKENYVKTFYNTVRLIFEQDSMSTPSAICFIVLIITAALLVGWIVAKTLLY